MSKIKTRKKSNPFLVGLFTIIGLSIVLLTLVWLGANEFFKSQNFYVTYFDTSIEGLTIGSPVKYQGVPVGIVNKIGVASDGKSIEVIMEIDPKIEINNKLRVKSAISGLAGGKFLQLHYPENPIMSRLYPKENFVLPENVIGKIKSAPSDIEEIQLAANEVISNLKTLEIGQISDKTIEFLNKSTLFLDTATNLLSNNELLSIISNLDKSSKSLSVFMKNIENTSVIEDLNKVGNKLLETSNRLNAFTVNLNKELDSMRLTNKVENTFEKYDSLVGNLNKSINLITFRTEKILLDMNDVFLEIEKSNKEIRSSLELLSNEPNRLISKPQKKKN